MGRSKVLLSVGHQTLLTYQVEQFQSSGASVSVVLGHQAQVIIDSHNHLKDINWILNPSYEEGMSNSVKQGFASLSASVEACFFTPIDHVTHQSVIQQLMNKYIKEQPLITSPLIEGKKGHPILFHQSIFPEIQTINEATQGLRIIMKRYHNQIVTVPVDWLGSKLDLDTPDDYKVMMTYLNEKGMI